MGRYKCWLDQPYLLVEQVRMVLAAYENLDFLLFGIKEVHNHLLMKGVETSPSGFHGHYLH